VSPVEYVIRVEEVTPRHLAAARGVTSRADLGATILKLLDRVWPVVREQGVQTGHNVVVYLDGAMTIEAGVEVFGAFASTPDVHAFETPSGTAVTTTHFGEYTDVSAAYAALEQWFAGNSRRRAGPSWEVYGDWSEDPQQRRMDVYFLLA
jgi:effector-binding domain-containing protein